MGRARHTMQIHQDVRKFLLALKKARGQVPTRSLWRQTAPAAHRFRNNPRRIPTREAAKSEALTFILNAFFQRELHTPPFRKLKLPEYNVNYKHDSRGRTPFCNPSIPPSVVFLLCGRSIWLPPAARDT